MLTAEKKEIDFLLRDSVDNNFRGFSVHYQPQVIAGSGRLYGAEALARWRCGRYGEIEPDVFVPILEENGKIYEFSRWMFQQAAAQCSKWLRLKPDFHMSVNLSCRHMEGTEICWFIEKTLREFELPTAHITVELTESWPLYCDSALEKNVLSLQQTGIQIAMDDFGSGYSSLLSLKNFPFDLVKFDRGFVSGILQDKTQAAFIPSLTSLCHNIGRSVCLEGVETEAEYRAVRRLGIELLQGYYFGRPVPAVIFENKYLR